MNHWYGFSWIVVLSFMCSFWFHPSIPISKHAFEFFSFFPAQEKFDLIHVFDMPIFLMITEFCFHRENYKVIHFDFLRRILGASNIFFFFDINDDVDYLRLHRTSEKCLKFGSFKISHHKVYETIKSKHKSKY